MSVFGMAAQNDSIMTRAVSTISTYYGVQGNIGINSISASNLTQHNKPDFGAGFYHLSHAWKSAHGNRSQLDYAQA